MEVISQMLVFFCLYVASGDGIPLDNLTNPLYVHLCSLVRATFLNEMKINYEFQIVGRV